MRRTLAALALALHAAAPAAQNLLEPAVRDLLHEELSGELAKDDVIAITRQHRIQGSRGYRRAAEFVLERLRAAGFDEQHAWIESFPSDGRIHYQTWQSPSGWDIESGELRMLEPREERIVAYPEIAMSVVTYSNPGDVTAELVWVGRGTSAADYEGKDVRGKFVLATGYGGAVHRLAVLEHGAAAVVCFLDDERAREYPDMLAYTGMWPKTDELERTTFGFNLTQRQGRSLLRLLEAGERVVLRGRVTGIGLEPYAMDVVVATLPGAGDDGAELVLSAHLDHPKESANDNASGSAAILDVARALQSLVSAGRLPRPARTLRFLWVPEWYGTMAYIDAHPELCGPALGGKVLANLNLDMVGENLELLHCRMQITRTLHSVPSALDALLADVAAMVDGMDVRTPRGSLSAFNDRLTPYAGGSDHMMFLDRKVPAAMFWHDPDYAHHTSEDTPDKVDPVELERCALIAAGAAWILAGPSEEQALRLVWLTAADAAAELHAAAGRAMAEVQRAQGEARHAALAEAHGAIFLGAERAAAAVRSVLAFRDGALLEAVVAGRVESLAATAQRAWTDLLAAAGVEGAAAGGGGPERVVDARVPVRTTRGPLAFDLPERALPPERAAWYDAAPLDGEQRFEIVNFVDGARSVTAIRDRVAAEFGSLPQEAVARFVEDLVAVEALAWRE